MNFFKRIARALNLVTTGPTECPRVGCQNLTYSSVCNPCSEVDKLFIKGLVKANESRERVEDIKTALRELRVEDAPTAMDSPSKKRSPFVEDRGPFD